MSVWLSKVSYQISSHNLRPASSLAAGLAGVADAFVALAAVILVGGESFTAAIRMGVRWHNGTAGKEYVSEVRCGTVNDSSGPDFFDAGYANHGLALAPDGDGGAVFFAGGELKIEKDFGADELRFFSPLGNFTTPLSTLVGSHLTNKKLEPKVLQTGIAAFAVPGTYPHQFTAQWTNFYGAEDGVTYRGAPLSQNQPGIWATPAWTGSIFVSNEATRTHVQNWGNDEIDLASNLSDTAQYTLYIRTWNGGDVIQEIERDLDAKTVVAHGVLFVASIKRDDPGALLLSRSYDNGATFDTLNIHTDSRDFKTSPNVEWDGRQLVALWHDGQDVVMSNSADFGANWSDPLLVLPGLNAVTPGNLRPSILFLPAHGLCLHFYWTGSDLELIRWSILGAEYLDVDDTGIFPVPDPILIFAGAPDLRYDTGLATDGTPRVAWSAASVNLQYKSDDWGKTWDNEISGATTESHTRRCTDFGYGLTYHLFWDSTGGLLARPSEDAGVTFLLDPPSLTDPGRPQLSTAAVEQTADIDVLADSSVVVAYFNPADDAIISRRSLNQGRSFV